MTLADDLISDRIRAADFREWRSLVETTGGCAAPIRLRGSSTLLDRDGSVLASRDGDILAPCGNRRESVCQPCSARYAGDAFHLVRAGLAGDDTKGVPVDVQKHPRAFLTLTAPSFGPVHTRRTGRRGVILPCGCGERHHPADTRLGTAVDPDTYDYEGAVLWQAHAGLLWARFTTKLRRALAAALGLTVRDFRDHARLSYAKVAEYQRRGAVHFHAAVRLDGPDGPGSPCPRGLTLAVLRAAVHTAAAQTVLAPTSRSTRTVVRPDGSPLELRWGAQIDLREITPAVAGQMENEAGEITDASLAGYIAKYATKGTGARETPDRPIRDIDHLEYLDVSPHHARIIRTCWDLGGLDAYAELGLRRWAHMLGFRGHFLTKSQAYSTTFRALAADRRRWRLVQDLEALGRATDSPDEFPPDPADFVVVNDWVPVAFGHRNEAERELAGAIADRNATQRRTARTTRRAAA